MQQEQAYRISQVLIEQLNSGLLSQKATKMLFKCLKCYITTIVDQ